MRTTEKHVWLALVYLCNVQKWAVIDAPKKIREEFEADHLGEKRVKVRFAAGGECSGFSLQHNAWGWHLERYSKGSTGVSRVSHFEGCTAREMWERLHGAREMIEMDCK